MGSFSQTKNLAARTARSVAESRLQTAAALAALALTAFVSPFSAAASGLAAFLLLLARRKAKADPFAEAFVQTDGDPRKAVYTLGYEEDGAPIRMDPREMRHHLLVSQRACLGRHEYLLALAEEMIAKGTGLIYVSPEANVGLPARVYAAAASLGREDDVMFVTAGWQGRSGRENAFDYFETGKGHEIAKTVVDLIDWHVEVSDHWKMQITELATVVVEARVWLRDMVGEPFDVDVLREALSFSSVFALARGSLGEPLPSDIKDRLLRYIESIPEYNPERGNQQSLPVMEYHGSIQMWVSKSLHYLSDSGMMSASTSRIDLAEVLENRRILVVMLQPSSRNPYAVKANGSAFVSMLRHTLSAVVDEISSRSDVEFPTGGPAFPIILDGIESYASGDMRILASHASMLGCSIIYGCDDRTMIGTSDPAGGPKTVARATTVVQLLDDVHLRLFVGETTRDLKQVRARPKDRVALGRLDIAPTELLSLGDTQPFSRSDAR